MEPSKQVNDTTDKPSCSTCVHKTTSGLNEVPMLCWDCTSFKTLVHWEPKVKPVDIQQLYRGLYGEVQGNEVEKQMVNTPKLEPLEYAKLHTAPDSALGTQVGGNHYKHLKVQPMEFSMANGLDACQHTIIKYVTRYESKGGIEDLLKARHALDMLIEFKYGKGTA